MRQPLTIVGISDMHGLLPTYLPNCGIYRDIPLSKLFTKLMNIVLKDKRITRHIIELSVCRF